jgi:hypothetical protein
VRTVEGERFEVDTHDVLSEHADALLVTVTVDDTP